MEFNVYFVIAIVFLASFFTLLFISKLPRGKTFDEVLAEKRQLAEKLYGPNYGKKGGNAGGKKNQKSQNNKKSNKAKGQKNSGQPKDEPLTEEHESGTNSDENVSDDNSNQVSHVEFVDVEIIPQEPVNVGKKPASSNKLSNPPPKRKNSKSPGTGILINKDDPTLVKNVVNVEQLNNFDEIKPKDVVEMKRDNVSVIIICFFFILINCI